MTIVKYSWGVDGFGRQHITLKKSVIVIFCVIPGNSFLDCCDLLDETEASKQC